VACRKTGLRRLNKVAKLKKKQLILSEGESKWTLLLAALELEKLRAALLELCRIKELCTIEKMG
jgi:hypothetical protein